MTPLAWMIAPSIVSWLIVTALVPGAHPEALLGMIGPLVSASLTWIATARVQALSPERVTRVMVVGLWVKMVFFAVYVVTLLQGLGLRAAPFVVSFAAYFIALHAIEAFFLRRLFMEGARAVPRA